MRPAAITLALAGTALFPASAPAYVVGGNAWPGKTIRYYTAARAYKGAVDRAARNWNRANVGVRFASSSRASADVVVRYGTERCGGLSPMGYGGKYEGTTVRLGAGCSRRFITLTATHEFGHVLGLDHEDSKCARLNPSFSHDGTPLRCRHHSLSYWIAHPLEPDDIAGARAIYRNGVTPPASDDRRPPWWR
jgi:Astacin (Peptidase family M12A)